MLIMLTLDSVGGFYLNKSIYHYTVGTRIRDEHLSTIAMNELSFIGQDIFVWIGKSAAKK